MQHQLRQIKLPRNWNNCCGDKAATAAIMARGYAYAKIEYAIAVRTYLLKNRIRECYVPYTNLNSTRPYPKRNEWSGVEARKSVAKW